MSSSYCQTQVRRDGNWWNPHSLDSKHSYIVGFFDGTNLGFDFSVWNILDNENESDCLNSVVESYTFYFENYSKNVTNTQLADGLDVFFSDYRNRSILIKDAVWIVLNTIAGTSQENIDILIENLRKNTKN